MVDIIVIQYIKVFCLLCCGPSSSVGIETDYELDGPG